MRRDQNDAWQPWYHGYYPQGTPQRASFLHWIDSRQDSRAFEEVLAKTPSGNAIWLDAHTHTKPDDTHGGKSHIEQRWGTTFINVAGLTQHHGPAENQVPRSWLLTFTAGSDEVKAQRYLHGNSYAPQGWYDKVSRVIKLSTPFRMALPSTPALPASSNSR
jgi:hypothetical protein